MKDVGFTMDGNHLVEMNKDEYAEFTSLRAAVEGKVGLPDFWEPNRGSFPTFIDFSSVFRVIKVWYLHHFKINELQELLDAMRGKLS